MQNKKSEKDMFFLFCNLLYTITIKSLYKKKYRIILFFVFLIFTIFNTVFISKISIESISKKVNKEILENSAIVILILCFFAKTLSMSFGKYLLSYTEQSVIMDFQAYLFEYLSATNYKDRYMIADIYIAIESCKKSLSNFFNIWLINLPVNLVHLISTCVFFVKWRNSNINFYTIASFVILILSMFPLLFIFYKNMKIGWRASQLKNKNIFKNELSKKCGIFNIFSNNSFKSFDYNKVIYSLSYEYNSWINFWKYKFIINLCFLLASLPLVLSFYFNSGLNNIVSIFLVIRVSYSLFLSMQTFIVSSISMQAIGSLIINCEKFKLDRVRKVSFNEKNSSCFLKIKNLSIKNMNFYHDVSLEYNSSFCISGPNGSGKTSICDLILGINSGIAQADLEFYTEKGLNDINFAIIEHDPGIYSDDIIEIKNNLINKQGHMYDEINKIIMIIKFLSSDWKDTSKNNRSVNVLIKIINLLIHLPDIIIFDETLDCLDINIAKFIIAVLKNHVNLIVYTTHRRDLMQISDQRIILQNNNVLKNIQELLEVSNKNFEVRRNIACP